MNTTEHIDDRDVQRAVSQELQWTPGLDDATGTVRSWPEKSQAADAAWASPHVTYVDNRIEVRAR